MDSFTALLEAGVTSPWFLPILFVSVVVDAVIPTVPAETLLVTTGAYAAASSVNLTGAFLVAVPAAVIGDSLAFYIGRKTQGTSAWVRKFRVGGAALDHIERILATRAGSVIVSARFIPGGRTAVTYLAGYTGVRLRTFLVFEVIGAVLWTSYIIGLGYLAGLAFEERPLFGLILGLAMAVALQLVAEVARRAWERRSRRKSRSRGVEARARERAEAAPAYG